MSCNSGTNNQNRFGDAAEFGDDMAAFADQQSLPLKDIFKYAGIGVSLGAAAANLAKDFSVYNLGKIFAGTVGSVMGGAISSMLAVELVLVAGLGSVAFLPGLLIGTAAFIGSYYGGAWYLEKYEEEFGPGSPSDATNGSDPSNGCDGNRSDGSSDGVSESGASGPFDNPPITPLVLDMNGDGIELIALEDSHTQFDMDGDNFAELTGWVGADDALLAMDRNGNGEIDNITELFGSAEAEGFDELAELDSTAEGGNGDGVIDANDATFGDLLVWIDADGGSWRSKGLLACQFKQL